MVLCPGRPKRDNKKVVYDQIKDGLYLGGQTRMKAAVIFSKHANTVIVVGGSPRKANYMKQYLVSNGVPSSKIIRVESDSDTTGNMFALKKISEDYKITGNIGILTNFYHMNRSIRFAQDIFVRKDSNKTIYPVVAETVTELVDCLKYKDEYIKRVAQEIQGLKDWENEVYGIDRYGCHAMSRDEGQWTAEINSEDKKLFLNEK